MHREEKQRNQFRSPARLAGAIRKFSILLVACVIIAVVASYFSAALMGLWGGKNFTHPITALTMSVALLATLKQRPMCRSTRVEAWLWRLVILLTAGGPWASYALDEIVPPDWGRMGVNTAASFFLIAASQRFRDLGKPGLGLLFIFGACIPPIIAINGYILDVQDFHGAMSLKSILGIMGLAMANAVRFTRYSLVRSALRDDRFSRIIRAQIACWVGLALAVPLALRFVPAQRDQYYAIAHTTEMILVLLGLLYFGNKLAILFESAARSHRLLKTDQFRDHLTGAATRLGASEFFLRQSGREAMAVVLLDVDFFKSVNDTYGHDVGDKVLIRLVQVLKSELRVTDLTARWGGEEFLLLFPVKSEISLASRCEEIRCRVAKEIREDKELPTITVSIGAVMADAPSTANLSYWLSRADKALLAAKEAGRDRVLIWRANSLVHVRLEGGNALSSHAA